jgi:hypothetical protein
MCLAGLVLSPDCMARSSTRTLQIAVTVVKAAWFFLAVHNLLSA